jgi:hypothetical protein
MGIRRIWPTGWRAIVLLIVGSVMGANLIAPAVAHVSGWDHNWKEHIRPRADARYSRKDVRTLIRFSGTTTDTTISSTYEPIKTAGTFTKKRSSSVIQLTWTGHVSTEGLFCDFQLRIDGANDTGSADSSGGNSTGRVVNYSAESPASATTVFGGLGTGTRTVSIWVRGSATSCTINRGNFSMLVLVEELDPTAAGGTLGAGTTSPASAGMRNGETR